MGSSGDPVEEFAAAASAFRMWTCEGHEQGEVDAHEALLHLLRLCSCALHLPDICSDIFLKELKPRHFRDCNRDLDEAAAVGKHCARLPFNYHGEVFNPLTLPPEASLTGGLVDGFGDIYDEVVARGLHLYQRGHHIEATWIWAHGFRTHWGEHATGAIRALHAWLAAKVMERLNESE